MADGVVFTGALAERVVDSTRWVEEHAGRRGLPITPPAAAEAVFVRVTGSLSSGYYPGTVTFWSAADDAWVDYGAVKLKAANGETLTSGTRYLARPAGRTSGGDEAFVTVPGGSGGSSTVHGVLDGTLTQGSSATLSVYSGPSTDTGTNVTVYDFMLASGQTVAAGAHAFAALDATDGLYYVIAAPCS